MPARALAARIRAGTSLEAVAREAGFNSSGTELRDRENAGQCDQLCFCRKRLQGRARRGGRAGAGHAGLVCRAGRRDRAHPGPQSCRGPQRQIAEQLTTEKRSAAGGGADLTSENRGRNRRRNSAGPKWPRRTTSPSRQRPHLLANGGRAFGRVTDVADSSRNCSRCLRPGVPDGGKRAAAWPRSYPVEQFACYNSPAKSHGIEV